MADIAAADVVYTISSTKKSETGEKSNLVSVAFGNGVLTYPSGGIPLTKASLGCPNNIRLANLINADSSNGFVYKYDLANNKVRIYQGDNDNAADAALIELVATTATPAAATLVIEAIGW